MKFDMNSIWRLIAAETITNLMKSYTMFSNEIAYSMHNAEFINSSDTAKSLMTDDRYFNFLYTAQHIIGLLRGLQTCGN